MRRLKIRTIVVSYNPYAGGFFPRCLDHLANVKLVDDRYQIDHQVIVVDNASVDNSEDKVKAEFGNIRVVQSGGNMGYAGGNNIGIKIALGQGCDYVAVVTQDVYVQPDWLLKAVKVAESDSKIGVVQPLLLLWNKQDLINSSGNQIHFLGYGYAGDYQKQLSEFEALLKEQNDQEVGGSAHKMNPPEQGIKDIPYFSGAAILFRAEALEKVGNFDEEMWMYNEDQDLGWRMWLNGYRNVLAPQSRAFHQYEFARSISKVHLMDRNRLITIFQNYHWATLLLISPLLLLHELASLLFALQGGWFKKKLGVWGYFLKPANLRTLLRKRRLRQGNRSVPEKEIVSRFTGKILFQDIQNPIVKYIANPILGAYWSIFKRIIFW